MRTVLPTLAGPRARPEQGFSLTELMLASAVLLVLVAVVLTTNLFGARMTAVTVPKLDATLVTDRVIERLVTEVRAHDVAWVGEGGLTSFRRFQFGEERRGNALQLQTRDALSFIRYYQDADDGALHRTVDGLVSEVIFPVVAPGSVFTLEGFDGSVLTNDEDRAAVTLTLELGTVGRANLPVGPEYLFKANQVEVRVARRGH